VFDESDGATIKISTARNMVIHQINNETPQILDLKSVSSTEEFS